MRYIKTINATFINFDEVVKIEHEYFYMKNGEKHDVYDCTDFFNLDVGTEEIKFNCEHHIALNEIVLKNIIKYFCDNTGGIYSIEDNENEIWEEFIEWYKEKLSEQKPNL